MRKYALLPAPLLLIGAAPASAPRLGWPIDCKLGKDCAIQSYQDDDPGPAARDYMCHGRTYAKHGGTDIRILSMAQQRRGVTVRAMAAGTVRGVRDGVPDISMRDHPAADIAGKECGNGVAIAHPGGWETQYCHMARGSIAVRPGEAVAAGQALGRVGLSGDTEFPHLHVTVRHDGARVDPFAAGRATGQCTGGASLWAATPPYRQGQVLVAGFSTGPLTMAQVQESGADQPRPDRSTPLVAFVQAIGLEQGDVQSLVLRGPDGALLAKSPQQPLDHDKAQTLLFVGRKAPDGGWRQGEYRADYSVVRGGRTVLTHSQRFAF